MLTMRMNAYCINTFVSLRASYLIASRTLKQRKKWLIFGTVRKYDKVELLSINN